VFADADAQPIRGAGAFARVMQPFAARIRTPTAAATAAIFAV